MGQYFYVANLDKKEYIRNLFLKQMEFSWERNPTALFLLQLLKGDWKGDRVVVVGDYSEYYPEGMKEEMMDFLKENPEALNEFHPDTTEIGLFSYVRLTFTQRFFNEYTLEEGEEVRLDVYNATHEDEEAYVKVCNSVLEDTVIILGDSYINLNEYYIKEEERRTEERGIECPYLILLSTPDGRGGGDFRGIRAVVGKYIGSRVSAVSVGDSALEGLRDITKTLIVDERYIPEVEWCTDISDISINTCMALAGMVSLAFLDEEGEDELLKLVSNNDMLGLSPEDVSNAIGEKLATHSHDGFHHPRLDEIKSGKLDIDSIDDEEAESLFEVLYSSNIVDMAIVRIQLKAFNKVMNHINN